MRGMNRPITFFLLLILLASFFFLALYDGCTNKMSPIEKDQVSAEEVVANCLQRMRKITSVHKIGEKWFKSENDSGIQGRSEEYIVFPDASHVIYKNDTPLYPDDIVEVWRIGKEKYVRYGDGRIVTSEAEEHDIFPELKILEIAQEAKFEKEESVEGIYCYTVSAKLPYDLEDINNGYLLMKAYIEPEIYLLKRLIIEDYPIRYFDKTYDDSYVIFYDILYSDYDQAFGIIPPDL